MAAVALDRRIAYTRMLMAQQASHLIPVSSGRFLLLHTDRHAHLYFPCPVATMNGRESALAGFPDETQSSKTSP